ncbi:MAG: aminoglycoside phosphotransferase family protein [Bryobacteraceae bacterium]
MQEYLRARVSPGQWRIAALGGGVSNAVFLATSRDRRIVVKQSLGRLRVDEEWLADRERIHRECDALRRLRPHLPEGSLPEVVFEDRENFVFGMEAAPEGALDWKTLLMRGDCDPGVARRAAAIFAALAQAPEKEHFAGQHCFDQLRIDPYYRFTAGRHPDLRERFDERIEACRRPIGLVHGDFSPKNLLVDPGAEGVLLIDFEVIHAGDPAFDAAFLLNHLLLKMVHGIEGCRGLALEFWRGVAEAVDERSAIAHLGCLHLARVDGKSPAEYLTPAGRERVRRQARGMILDPPKHMEEIFS